MREMRWNEGAVTKTVRKGATSCTDIFSPRLTASPRSGANANMPSCSPGQDASCTDAGPESHPDRTNWHT